MRPPRHRFALVNWVAVYPVITLVLWGLGPLLAGIPLPIETLIISAILVSLMNFAVMPGMTHLFRHWLHPKHHADPHATHNPPPDKTSR